MENLSVVEEAEQLRLFNTGVDVSRLRAMGEKLQTVPPNASNTQRGYAADWRMFEAWCAASGRRPLPASADTVWLYMTSMFVDRKCKSFTCTRHISAILHHHRAAEVAEPDVTKARELVSSVRRDRGERYEGKQALTPKQLARLVASCDPGTNAGTRDRAMLLLGFATSMRRSEIVALDLSDVSFESKGMAILVRKSKTDQNGRGRFIAVWNGEKPETDPVRLLRAWIERRGDWAGPLFPRTDGFGDPIHRERMLAQAVNQMLKRRLKRAGIDPRPYGSHSLRAGAITATAELGRSDQEIMNLSGHRSAAVMRTYVRRARVFDGRNPLAGVL